MSEQEALELARRLAREESVSEDGSDEALREALIARYHETWASGKKLDPATTFGVRKLKEYAAYLCPPEETSTQEDYGLAADEATCIESCREDKQNIKQVGEQIMADVGPIRSDAGRKAFLAVAKDRLAKGKKDDQAWLRKLSRSLRTKARS